MGTTISIDHAFATVTFHPRDRRPLYQQLAEGIAQHIRNGALPVGTRLPSLRDLAKRHAVALVTASQAYEALADEGLVESRTGRGSRSTARAADHGAPSMPRICAKA